MPKITLWGIYVGLSWSRREATILSTLSYNGDSLRRASAKRCFGNPYALDDDDTYSDLIVRGYFMCYMNYSRKSRHYTFAVLTCSAVQLSTRCEGKAKCPFSNSWPWVLAREQSCSLSSSSTVLFCTFSVQNAMRGEIGMGARRGRHPMATRGSVASRNDIERRKRWQKEMEPHAFSGWLFWPSLFGSWGPWTNATWCVQFSKLSTLNLSLPFESTY